MKVIIIDDEKMARSLLENMLLEFFNEIEIVAQCHDLPEGVKAIRKYKPEVVFLDIEMPGYSGLELLDFFNEDEIDFSIIFTTAYNQFAIQAFKLSAIDYLLKPIEPQVLIDSVERYKKNKEKKDYQILKNNLGNNGKKVIGINTLHSIIFIDIDDIVYAKADGSYTQIYLKEDNPIVSSKNLKYLEELLTGIPNFFRCHKSYLVNTNFIKEFIRTDGGLLKLKGNYEIGVSSDKVEDMLKLIKMN